MATYAEKLSQRNGAEVLTLENDGSLMISDNMSKLPSTNVAQAETGTVAVAGAALVIPVTHAAVTKTTGGVEALSLADGYPGQVLNISLTATGGDGTLTPATATGWATCVFTAAGDNLALYFVDSTVGWIVLGTAGVLAPPVLSV